jgi:hypothetical protein
MSEAIGRSGSDEEEVGIVGEIDMPGFPGILLVLQRNENRMASEGLKREGSDELTCGS